jgi:NAD(P)-dependent dehydrogenase (short-subunit alcohol dehydrogenase family)
MQDPASPARRRLVQHASLGVAASLAYPGWLAGMDAASGGQPSGAHASPDYPRPPFDEQSQPWPGLTGRMHPRPDHGETSYRGSGRLAGRKALITGGDSGIGRAVAIAYAREGADVAVSYLPQEEPDAQEVVQLIKKAGRKAVTVPGDIRDEAFCKTMVQQARQQLGGIDILVNNAARQQSHDSIEQIPSDQFDWTLKTNLYAMFWITREVVASMPSGGAIVCTASVNAYDPGENLLDYSMTKAAIVAFTKSLAKQMGKKGIRVNAVAPGPFWTPLQVTGGQTQKKLRDFGADTVLERPGQPAELAPIYVLLASNEASYITGQVFGASGGRGQP